MNVKSFIYKICDLVKSFSFKNPVPQMHVDTQCLHLPCLMRSSWYYQLEAWAVAALREQRSNGEDRMLYVEEISLKAEERRRKHSAGGRMRNKKKITLEVFVREIESRYASMTNTIWEGNGEKDFKDLFIICA